MWLQWPEPIERLLTITKRIRSFTGKIWTGTGRRLPNVLTGNLQRAFIFGKPDAESQIYDNNTYGKNYTYLGTIEEVRPDGWCRIEQKNKFSVGEAIEVMKPDGRNVQVTVRGITDENGIPQESAPHPKQILYVDLGTELSPYDILRRSEMDPETEG